MSNLPGWLRHYRLRRVARKLASWRCSYTDAKKLYLLLYVGIRIYGLDRTNLPKAEQERAGQEFLLDLLSLFPDAYPGFYETALGKGRRYRDSFLTWSTGIEFNNRPDEKDHLTLALLDQSGFKRKYHSQTPGSYNQVRHFFVGFSFGYVSNVTLSEWAGYFHEFDVWTWAKHAGRFWAAVFVWMGPKSLPLTKYDRKRLLQKLNRTLPDYMDRGDVALTYKSVELGDKVRTGALRWVDIPEIAFVEVSSENLLKWSKKEFGRLEKMRSDLMRAASIFPQRTPEPEIRDANQHSGPEFDDTWGFYDRYPWPAGVGDQSDDDSGETAETGDQENQDHDSVDFGVYDFGSADLDDDELQDIADEHMAAEDTYTDSEVTDSE